MTQTLPKSPLSRLAPLRRVPFWAQALALCALFAIVGVAVLDDYGIHGDEAHLRRVTRANVDYIATGDISELSQARDVAYRYYGLAFEMPLLLAERALGLQDSRHIYLMRHLIAHLFFIAGGFACGMLAYRMLGSRWVALLAMLLFLLHPRLYAHSFFNIKDIPFTAMLVVTLYLTYRAFRRDTIGAFLLCGIVVGLAINLRPFGLILLPLILAMRALDLWQAGREERMRIIATAGIFLAAALAVVYIIHPYYWENPLRLIEGVRALSQHPALIDNLFMGEIYPSIAVPWNYIPVWFAITAPPVALLLGAVGCAAVCWRCVSRPLAAPRDRETRFLVLLLGCFALPVAVVIALQANIYHGWRQMYFLWGPFCLLAAVGLHTIANIRMGGGIWKVGSWLPSRVRRGGMVRAMAYGATGVGLATTLTAIAALHPHQQVYFNALVDTKTPSALGKRYDMDYWRMAQRQSLEYLLDRYPDETLRVWTKPYHTRILPQNDRERILIPGGMHTADYFIHPFFGYRNLPEEPAVHSVRAYGSGIAFTLDTGLDAYRDYYRAEYVDVEANGTWLAHSGFDIYLYDGELRYLKENCEPLFENANAKVFLHIFPADLADLPTDRREYGFENWGFQISEFIAFFDGKCIHRRPRLPNYPIARIRTGQHVKGEVAWRADIDLAAHAAAQALYESIAAGDYGQPVARSDFDVYRRGNALAYLKENCVADDTDARFFLHIVPTDPADLPAVWREFGIENRDFWFIDHGAYAGDKCVAERELPDYPIARIRTGQNAAASGGDAWRVDVNPAARAAAQTISEDIAAGDYGQPVARSDFDVYLRGNGLAYLKENCVADDTDARFFLHIVPADPADLPAVWREYGFENLDFHFADYGAYAGDKCVAERELPDYPIARIKTGQNAEASGGDAWRVDVNPAARAAAQAVYDGIAAGDYGQPVARSDFDVYLRGNALAYIKENCVAGDTDARFFLHIFPADPADLPAASREFGFANLDFHFADQGAYIGGKCVAARELPDYAIERIHTGQSGGDEGRVWRADIDLAAQALYESIVAGDYGQAVAQSDFDVYLRGNGLAYLKENCEQGDADARFFLHIIPVDPADLPADERKRGFANLDFRFADLGARSGDICVAERELPDYPLDRIRTGQFVSGEGAIWRVEFAARQ